MKFGFSDEQLRQVQTILAKYPAITEAVVFGSRAMGNYKEASDVDIALKGNITASMVADVKYALEEDTYLPFFFDIIAYGIVDNPKLKEQIDNHGVALYRAGWKECKLGDVVVFQRGHDLPKTEMNAGLFPVAGSNGIIGHHNEATTKGPGITIGRSGNIGTPKFYKDDFWAHNTVLYVKDFRGNDEKFIFYFLHTFDFSGFNAGSAVPTLNRNHIHEIPVAIPPLSTQRDIAVVLSSLDDKIDLLYRQNKTLEGMASALWRKMFVEEAGSEWETTTIGEVATINGKSIDKDYTFAEIEYLDTGSITEGRISEYQHLQLKDAPSRARRIVQKNDIVVSMVRPIQKHYGILKKINSNTIVSTGFVVISCVKIDPHFIYVLLTQKEMTEYLDIIAEASTTTYPSLAPSDIAKIDFQMPPTELLQQFSEYAGHVWDKIEENNSQIRTLSRSRDTLLPKLMSGEVRLSVG